MQRAFAGVLLAFGLLMSAPPVARAHCVQTDAGSSVRASAWAWLERRGWAPELPERHARHTDAGAAGAALTLLVGSIAVAAGKKRRDP